MAVHDLSTGARGADRPRGADTPGERPRAPRSGWAGLGRLRPWASTVAVVVVWWLLARTVGEPTVLPAPGALVLTAAEMTRDGTLPQALVVSLGRVLVGSGIGITVGVLLGLVAGFWRVGEDLVDRPVQMLRTIPFTALTPLLLLWFGLGETPKIVLVAVATVVPMYLNAFGGVRGVDHKLLEVARSCRLSRWRTATHVLLPGALAPILVGLRHALGVAWIAVIVAEMVNSSAGIGHLLSNARTYLRTDVVMVCIAVYAVLGLLTDGIVRGAEKHLLRWRTAATTTGTGSDRT